MDGIWVGNETGGFETRSDPSFIPLQIDRLLQENVLISLHSPLVIL